MSHSLATHSAEEAEDVRGDGDALGMNYAPWPLSSPWPSWNHLLFRPSVRLSTVWSLTLFRSFFLLDRESASAQEVLNVLQQRQASWNVPEDRVAEYID